LVASSPITIISCLLSRFLSRPRYGLNLRRPILSIAAAAAAATVQKDLRVEEEDDEEEDASIARTTHSLWITVVRD
jgi:hypothetical protein